MDAIKFLRDKCGFSCGDPDSEISRAWAEIEATVKDAKRYEFVRGAEEKMEGAILVYNYGEDLSLLSGDELDSFVDAAMNGANA